MSALLRLWKREPVLVMSAAQALVLMAVAFGVNVTAEQQGAIFAAVAALLALLTGVTVRRTTTRKRV